ncbi:MAG: serine/threonine-protein kinase [Planctomycetota bacterium]|nr:serine/threonine-protein kinase [Planctomycetota bacterium]
MSAGPTSSDDVPDRFSVDFTGLTLLGIYRVVEKMADGGMGSIYLGEDTNLGRRVVVKVPHARFLGEPGFRGRFRREIDELVRLEHPAIVRILAQGEHDDVPFFVLQYLGGGSLEDVLAASDEPQDPEEVLAWFEPIAKTLDYVHARGTVHRDVKPANILFDEDGHVFLSDFGVAKALENEELNLTAAGTGIGSPRYMAPEQAVGDDLTGKADQYALGSMLYEALTSRPPFEQTSAIELLVAKKSSDPEPLAEVAPHVPGAAAEAVMRAMAREPDARHASCLAFLDAYREALRPEPAVTSVAEAPPRRPWLVLLVFLAVLGGGAWWLLGQGDGPSSEPGVIEETGALRLTLIEQGAEPRRAMRYALTEGSVEHVDVWMRKRMTSLVAEKQAPEWAIPDVRWHLELRVAKVAADGSATLQWSARSVEFEWMEEAPPRLREAMEPFRVQYEKFACEVDLSANGLPRDARLLLPEDVPALSKRELTSMFLSIRSLAIPFPSAPVGVGARWEVTETADMLGLRLTQTMTYELEALEADRTRFTAYAAQTAPRQKMDMALGGLGRTVDTELASLHTNSASDGEGILTRAAPLRWDFEMKMNLEVAIHDLDEEGQRTEDAPEMGKLAFDMQMKVKSENP